MWWHNASCRLHRTSGFVDSRRPIHEVTELVESSTAASTKSVGSHALDRFIGCPDSQQAAKPVVLGAEVGDLPAECVNSLIGMQ